jgi:hypothetical protein
MATRRAFGNDNLTIECAHFDKIVFWNDQLSKTHTDLTVSGHGHHSCAFAVPRNKAESKAGLPVQFAHSSHFCSWMSSCYDGSLVDTRPCFCLCILERITDMATISSTGKTHVMTRESG